MLALAWQLSLRATAAAERACRAAVRLLDPLSVRAVRRAAGRAGAGAACSAGCWRDMRLGDDREAARERHRAHRGAEARRRARSIAIALALGALVLLFYVVTLVKGPDVLRCGRCDRCIAKQAAAPRHADRRRLRRGASPAWSALAYAAVPLYDWFCRVTGFDGTTQVARIAPERDARPRDHRALRRQCRPGLPWRFEPEQNSIEVQHRRGGHASTTRVINESDARDHGAGVVQRHADYGRRLFQQDQLLLLHRADAEAGRDARDAGGVLRRSGDRRGPRPGRAQHHHAVLHLLPAARAGRAGGGS